MPYPKSGKCWSVYEEAIVRGMYSWATQEVMLAELPGRTWTAIRFYASRLKVKRAKEQRWPSRRTPPAVCQ